MSLSMHLERSADELKTIYISTLARGHGVVSREIQGERAAKEILGNGYSKPRTVRTMEDLERMPLQSVIRTHRGGVFIKHYDHFTETDNWEAKGANGIHPGDLPAIVLDELEQQQ